MKSPSLSIIMPVYNSEQYVESAIKSVINQTYNDWELIIVNDGSTDKSLSICQYYTKRDNRISCYSKLNGGQASARNLALDKVKGKFITFIDSDDELLDSTTYEKAIRALMSNQDISFVQYGCSRILEDGRTIPDFYCGSQPLLLSSKREFFERVEVVSDYLSRKRSLSSGQWDKIYRKKIFDGLRYKEGTIFEDTSMSVHLFNRANSILIIPEGSYGYYFRDNSTTTKKRTLKAYQDQLNSQLGMLEGLIVNRGEKDDVKIVVEALKKFIIGIFAKHGLKSDLSNQIITLNRLCELAKVSGCSGLRMKLYAFAHITFNFLRPQKDR